VKVIFVSRKVLTMFDTRFLPKWRIYRVLNLATGQWLEIEAVSVEFAVIKAAQDNGQGDCDLHIGKLTYGVGDFVGMKEQ
jgi:hypothetical protein